MEGIDIGKSFTFVFDDENWISKVLIGGLFVLLSFVLIGIPFLIGYMLEVIVRAKEDHPQPLPDWSDLGGYFSRGIQGLVVVIVYALPIILVGCLLAFAQTAMGSSGTRGGGGAMNLLALCLNCLIFIWSVVMAVAIPAALIKVAETQEIMSGFRFGELWAFIRENLSNYLIAIVLAWIASIIAGFGIILCGIGVVFTYFWGYMVQAHLLGQVARAAAGPTAPPTATAPFSPEGIA